MSDCFSRQCGNEDSDQCPREQHGLACMKSQPLPSQHKVSWTHSWVDGSGPPSTVGNPPSSSRRCVSPFQQNLPLPNKHTEGFLAPTSTLQVTLHALLRSVTLPLSMVGPDPPEHLGYSWWFAATWITEHGTSGQNFSTNWVLGTNPNSHFSPPPEKIESY